MKAQLLTGFGGVDQITLTEVPEPHAGPGEVRLTVEAVGINPMDVKIQHGWLQDEFDTPLPAVLGSDVVGVVDEVGTGVTAFSVGDRVVGLAEDGAYAEYAVVRSTRLAAVPDRLSADRAATIPTAAEASRRVLALLGAQAGEMVVVNGAAGSVGSAAVQLLMRDGVRVIGTAGPDNQDYLRSLGAEPVRYGDGVEERIRAFATSGVDAVFDVTGYDFVDTAIRLRGGADRIVTIADFGASERGVIVSAGDGSSITSNSFLPVLQLAAEGSFITEIAATFAFADLPAAHELSEGGHLRGKIVLHGPGRPEDDATTGASRS